LWSDGRAEEAARFYTSIFPNSRIKTISHYPAFGREVHGMEAGSVLTVEFELDGQPFTVLNGPPIFKYTEAVSLQVPCDTKEELDYYWERLGEGGDEAAQQCGWLKDKYGLSWQVFPRFMIDYLLDPDQRKVERVFAAMMKMKKLDFDELRRVFAG
jgi:predicted 3-demethylubiquinone-9 3-methyltransferase (glyoxalase superfamily)